MVDNKVALRTIARTRISGRLREFVMLLVAIIVGMLLTANVNAQQPRHKVIKAKRACAVLAQKRNEQENIRVTVRKPKYKPMAEAEAPASYRIMARREERNR